MFQPNDDFWRHVNLGLYGCHPPVQFGLPVFDDPAGDSRWEALFSPHSENQIHEDYQSDGAAEADEEVHVQQQGNYNYNEEGIPTEPFAESSPSSETQGQDLQSPSRSEGTGFVSSTHPSKKRSRDQTSIRNDTEEDHGSKKRKGSSQKSTSKRPRDQDGMTDGDRRASKKQKVAQPLSQNVSVMTNDYGNQQDLQVVIKYRPKGSRINQYYDVTASGWSQQSFDGCDAQLQREIIQGLRGAGAQLKEAPSASSASQTQQVCQQPSYIQFSPLSNY